MKIFPVFSLNKNLRKPVVEELFEYPYNALENNIKMIAQSKMREAWKMEKKSS